MKVTILGTGCLWTKRACANYLVNDNVVVDPGLGSVKQLLRSNDKLLHHEKIENIDLILISHFHNDHYFDIPLIISKDATGKYPDKKLTIVCPEGGKEKIKLLCELGLNPTSKSFQRIDFDKYIDFIEAEDDKVINVLDFEITCKKLDHGPIDNFGYIIKKQGEEKVLGFSGDTTMCPNLMELIEKSDVAFVDMAGTHKSAHHYNIIEGIDLMKKYDGKKVIIPAHLTSQALDYSRGKIFVPQDLMVVDTTLPVPYSFKLEDRPKKKKNTNFLFKIEGYDELVGRSISLSLAKTEIENPETQLPTYHFDIIVNETQKDIGNLFFTVTNQEHHTQTENVSFAFTNPEDENLSEYTVEALKLVRTLAMAHDYNKVYLATSPDDMQGRRICESFGATLKEIATTNAIDGIAPSKAEEKCIWEWHF